MPACRWCQSLALHLPQGSRAVADGHQTPAILRRAMSVLAGAAKAPMSRYEHSELINDRYKKIEDNLSIVRKRLNRVRPSLRAEGKVPACGDLRPPLARDDPCVVSFSSAAADAGGEGGLRAPRRPLGSGDRARQVLPPPPPRSRGDAGRHGADGRAAVHLLGSPHHRRCAPGLVGPASASRAATVVHTATPFPPLFVANKTIRPDRHCSPRTAHPIFRFSISAPNAPVPDHHCL